MLLLPTTTAADVATAVAGYLADNAVAIVGLIGLAVGTRITMGLVFKRGANKIKA